ncbi:hypothetical protein HDE_05137 [Halotydeus destructor]|nr:hypothetical protein HDE_05137 [Halotydeus destructor]
MKLFALIAALLLAGHCLAEGQFYPGPDHRPYLRKGESTRDFFYRKARTGCYSLPNKECLLGYMHDDFETQGNGCWDTSTGFDSCCYGKWKFVCWDGLCDAYDEGRDGPRALYANLTTCKT